MPHRALETAVAPGAIAERQYVSHGALVMPTMTAVSKPNNIPSRLETMMDSDVRHAVRALPLDAAFVRMDACRTTKNWLP